MTEEESLYRLSCISGIYRRKIKKLLDIYQSANKLFELSNEEINKINILTENEKKAIIDNKNDKRIMERFCYLKEQNIEFISCKNPCYPEKLKNIADAPWFLFKKGKLNEKRPSVAIVGARNCSNYGKEMALYYARELAENGVTIISGLARGIDSYAHKGALESGGETIAVLGCGVNVCYPKENYQLYCDIANSGGIISEYQVDMQPRPMFFPERNRIISGLADIILVVEARIKSGSLITADCALEQGKDVFAIPGRVTDSLSSGCNQLISQGAAIANSPSEILNELGIKYEKNKKLLKKSNNLLERKENMLYSCLDLQPKSLDEILSNIDLTYKEILMTLVDLEIKGLIKETSKNYYVRIDVKNHK